MAVAFVLGLPFYLFFWQGPEDFIADHPGISLALWLAGMMVAVKVLFVAGIPIRIPSDAWKPLLGGLLLVLGSCLLVLMIAVGLAYLAHLDAPWARDALEH